MTGRNHGPLCWEDGGNSTCLLLDEHSGPHRFTSDDQIAVGSHRRIQMTDLDNELRAIHWVYYSNGDSYCNNCQSKFPCTTIQLLDKHKEGK